jgi:hypothetical protein
VAGFWNPTRDHVVVGWHFALTGIDQRRWLHAKVDRGAAPCMIAANNMIRNLADGKDDIFRSAPPHLLHSIGSPPNTAASPRYAAATIKITPVRRSR